MDISLIRRAQVPLSLETIGAWFRQRAGAVYGGEKVTQLEHALQCAALAQKDGAEDEVIVAAFLHDIGHLAEHEIVSQKPHEKVAAHLLDSLFGADVIEPIRLHVDAKRYLCASDPFYWNGLSAASKRSLIWQDGPFTASEAIAFIAQPYAEQAVRLRLWDDAAKVSGLAMPSLESILEIVNRVALPQKSFIVELA